MYTLNDKQIDYILNDIRARGVELESLQLNLLDHICCIIERNLEENGDFESFYQITIRTFYKDALWEIEEETISLLTFKNYYVMKKTLIISGTFSAVAMVFGIIFKFTHWPGASMFIVLGIVSASFIFLPLFFTLKAREKQQTKDKLVIGIGALAASLLSLSILFRVMHWPYAFMMGNCALAMMLLLFLPVYFFGGVRNPDTKVNTIASSIVIILACGLLLTLIRSPKATHMVEIRDTSAFIAGEQIVRTEQKQLEKIRREGGPGLAPIALSEKINTACEELKSVIIEQQTGAKTLDATFESRDALLRDQNGVDPFTDPASSRKIATLIAMIDEYNGSLKLGHDAGLIKIPTRASFIEYYKKGDTGLLTTLGLLNQLSQVQMYVLQNERELLAVK